MNTREGLVDLRPAYSELQSMFCGVLPKNRADCSAEMRKMQIGDHRQTPEGTDVYRVNGGWLVKIRGYDMVFFSWPDAPEGPVWRGDVIDLGFCLRDGSADASLRARNQGGVSE